MHRARQFALLAGVALYVAPRFAISTEPAPTTDEALQKLRQGNARFVAGSPEHPNADQPRLKITAENGQNPFATVIACSDSRVPVELLFDQGVGDIFVIRVAGNVCDTDEIGSIEYGVDHLQTPILVVLGHTGCGAVTAVATGAELHGSIPPLVDNIAPAVRKVKADSPELEGDALITAAVEQNVWQAVDDLFKASPATRKRVAAGTLRVLGAVYQLHDGKVRWLGDHPEQSRLLAYTGSPAHGRHDADATALADNNTVHTQHACDAHGGTTEEHPARPGKGADPRDVLNYLKACNQRYVANQVVGPRRGADRRTETTTHGQHPFATVIACSDSRVPVETLFDQGVGDIFVIRVAGNVCDTDEVGSIEYGVDHLETPVMLVLGHTHCGAVTAVVTDAELHGSIPPLVDNITPAVAEARKKHPHLHGKDLVPQAVHANVWQAIDDLFKTSPATRKRVAAGTLIVVGAIYDIDSGAIKWLGSHPDQTRLLAYTSQPQHHHTPHAVPAHHGDQDANAATAAIAQGAHGLEDKPSPVTLVDPQRLHQLDNARHQKHADAQASLPEYEPGFDARVLLPLCILGFLGLGLAGWKSGLFSNLSVGGKLYSAFSAVAAITLITGLIGFYYLNHVADAAKLAERTLTCGTLAGELGGIQADFLLRGIEDQTLGAELIQQHAARAHELHKELEDLAGRELDAVEVGAVSDVQKRTRSYDATFASMVEHFHHVEALREEIDHEYETMEHELSALVTSHESELAAIENAGTTGAELKRQTKLVEVLLSAQTLTTKLASMQARFMLEKHVTLVPAAEAAFGRLASTLIYAQRLLEQGGADADATQDLEHIATVQKEAAAFQAAFGRLVEQELIAAAEYLTCDHELEQLEATAIAMAERSEHKSNLLRAQANTVTIELIVLGAVLSVALALTITRGITRPVNAAIASLNEGAAQITTAASQVSSASQSLASGTSEQASSLEETSSSLEQMAAMTRTNADNASKAHQLSSDTQHAAEQGDRTTARLNEAMDGINDASDKISKIIKVIEEIAFQTNLLALNAAVEAARAGEHGKGFAVVADEVRNLALRAGQAAKETTALIEESVQRARDGATVAADVATALGGIVTNISQVSSLIDGIARASSEQAQGVEQINVAVSQIDKVVQAAAAGSEQSASAAEQLSAQAETLQGVVGDLANMVGGNAARHA